MLFRNGQEVHQGHPLFIIDPRPYRATLDRALAQIASAQATLANDTAVAGRSANLVGTGAVSKEELGTNQSMLVGFRKNEVFHPANLAQMAPRSCRICACSGENRA